MSGIYSDPTALNHDATQRVGALLDELVAGGATRATAVAAVIAGVQHSAPPMSDEGLRHSVEEYYGAVGLGCAARGVEVTGDLLTRALGDLADQAAAHGVPPSRVLDVILENH